MRENEVNIKLNPIRSVVEGKRVVLIDDSIVRGTTCRRTIDLLRKAGAKEIHMRVSAPPFVSECYYGTDIDDKNKLIANHHTVAEIAGIHRCGFSRLSQPQRRGEAGRPYGERLLHRLLRRAAIPPPSRGFQQGPL